MARNFHPDRTDKRGLQKNQRALETLLDLLTDENGDLRVSLLTHDHDGDYLLLDATNGPLAGSLVVETAGNTQVLTTRTGGASIQFQATVTRGQLRTLSSSHELWIGVSTAEAIKILSGNVTSILENTAFFSAGSFGGGNKVIFIANATTAPTSNPANGSILYCADVGASSEMFVRNENGDIARLTGTASRLTSDANSTSTTLADVAMSVRVESGKTYHLVATLICDTAGTDGIDVRLASTATTSGVLGASETFGLGLSVPAGGRKTLFPATLGNTHATGSHTGHVNARITFTTTSSGVVKVQLARFGAAGTATVKAGSILTLNEVG